jgi:hypothetical protein
MDCAAVVAAVSGPTFFVVKAIYGVVVLAIANRHI